MYQRGSRWQEGEWLAGQDLRCDPHVYHEGPGGHGASSEQTEWPPCYEGTTSETQQRIQTGRQKCL